MTDEPDAFPSPGALAEVKRLVGSEAVISGVVRLEGGQEADTWRVDTTAPDTRVVVREYPIGDGGAAREQSVLRALGGLDGWAPTALGGDLDGRWSPRPTSLISWVDGEADIIPSDPAVWAAELGRALARMHAVAAERLGDLPSVFDREGHDRLTGPLAEPVRSRWSELTAEPDVLAHSDFWSGNVVWRDGRLSGIVDWSGARRGPRGYDLGWCRLDLVLLYDASLADACLAEYEANAGQTIADVGLWDAWAAARSHDNVVTWVPNYAPLGRDDLTADELRRRHAAWTEQLSAPT